MRPAQLHPQSIYTPKMARIVKTRSLTDTECLLRLQFVDGSSLGHQAGQFV